MVSILAGECLGEVGGRRKVVRMVDSVSGILGIESVSCVARGIK